MKKERMALEKVVKDIFSKYDPDNAPIIVGMIPPMRNAVAELKDGLPLSEVMSQLEADVMLEYFPEEFKAQEQQEIEEAAKAAAAMPKPKPEVLPPSTVLPENFRVGGRVKLI